MLNLSAHVKIGLGLHDCWRASPDSGRRRFAAHIVQFGSPGATGRLSLPSALLKPTQILKRATKIGSL